MQVGLATELNVAQTKKSISLNLVSDLVFYLAVFVEYIKTNRGYNSIQSYELTENYNNKNAIR